MDNQSSYSVNVPLSSSASQWVSRLWKFSRPHTIIGTSLSVLSLFTITVALNPSLLNVQNLSNLLGTWMACLLGNIYIVGLNQVEDIEIDKINKPQLPLASGELSIKQGKVIVILTGIFALGLGGLFGQWLFLTVVFSLLLGTAYSLPPIRLKRFPLLAAFCILTVRGIIINMGLFQHFNHSSLSSVTFPPVLGLLILFIFLFSITIALFKDVPDLEGDRQYKINTFTLILGKSKIFLITQVTIIICYLMMIMSGFIKLDHINPLLMILIHFCLLLFFLWRSQKVDLDQKNEITSYYQFIWKLFFLEYILFPLTLIKKAI